MKHSGCLKAIALAVAAMFASISCGWMFGAAVAKIAGWA